MYSYAPGGGGPGGGLNDDQLQVGGWGDLYYSLLQLDLSGLPNHANAVVLRLYNNDRRPFPTGMYLDRIDQPWSWVDRLWWADKPATTQWRANSLPDPALNAWYEIDITDLYNGWKSGAFPNYGLQLRPTQNNNNFNSFYSSDYLVDPTLRPMLLITPTPTPTDTFPLTVSIHGDGFVVGAHDESSDDVIVCLAENVGFCSRLWGNGANVSLWAFYSDGVPGSTAPDFLWGGDCTGQGNPCTFTMTAAKNVSATFYVIPPPGSFTLTVSPPVNGTVVGEETGISCPGTCSGNFVSVATVILTANPDPGFTFGGFGGDPDCADGILTMNADTYCTATFTSIILPDLTGTWDPVSQSCHDGKCKLKGSVRVVNQGTATASASRLRILLSDDATLDPSDAVLKETKIKKLRPGREKKRKMKVTLPAGVSASGKYLFAVIDTLDLVVESNETNNSPSTGPMP